MAHSIMSDEINAGIPMCVQPMYTLKQSSWASLNVNKKLFYIYRIHFFINKLLIYHLLKNMV